MALGLAALVIEKTRGGNLPLEFAGLVVLGFVVLLVILGFIFAVWQIVALFQFRAAARRGPSEGPRLPA
jgi:hypothetical protein